MKMFFALTALLFAGIAVPAVAQTQVAATPDKHPPLVCKKSLQLPGADGSTAMAELPSTTLLYNDRHVKGADAVVESLRALGGLRCYSDLDSSSYLIGLRDAFEAMGGTVSVGPDKKTIDVEKPGVSIKLQIGRPTIALNGETRPLDVPPMVYHGIIYVPIRVISEGLGGYVVWDGAAKTVVIRYLPQVAQAPTPPPPPTLASPAPEETINPTPAPVIASMPPAVKVAKAAPSYEHFIAGDYQFATKTYNAFNSGNTGSSSFAARAAIEFPLGTVPFMVGGDFRSFGYPHEAGPSGFTVGIGTGPGLAATPSPYLPCARNGLPGCVSTPGRTASVYVPALDLRDTSISGDVGIGIFSHTYVAASFLAEMNDYPDSYPKIPTLSGFGFGLDRLPDFSQTLSFYASGYYYPAISGTYDYPLELPAPTADTSGKLQESVFKFQVGATAKLGESGLFLDAGFLGDSIRGKNLAPSDASHAGGYVGLGVKF